jgi:hypothetical protein
VAIREVDRIVLDVLTAMASPIARIAEEPRVVLDWCMRAGLRLPTSSFDLDSIRTAATSAKNAVEALEAQGGAISGLQSLTRFLVAAGRTIEPLRRFADAIPIPSGGGVSREELSSRLFQRLKLEAMDQLHPSLIHALEVLGLAEPWWASNLAAPEEDQGLISQRFSRFALEGLGALLSDPIGTLAEKYELRDMSDAAAVFGAADRLMPRLRDLGWSLGLEAIYGSEELARTTNDEGMNARGALLWRTSLSDGIEVGTALTLGLAPGGNLEVGFAPFGEIERSWNVGPWIMDLSVQGTVDALVLSSTDVELFGGGSDTFNARLSLEKSEAARVWSLGVPEGTRLELPPLEGFAFLEARASDYDAGAQMSLREVRLVVAAGEGDGFISRVLPSEPVTMEFDLSLGGSKRRGLYIDGSVGGSSRSRSTRRWDR